MFYFGFLIVELAMNVFHKWWHYQGTCSNFLLNVTVSECYRVFQCYTTESEYVTWCSSSVQLRVNMLQGVQWYTTDSEYVIGCSSAIQLRVNMLQGVPVVYNCECVTGCSSGIQL